jgi:uncharacterized protein YciI
MPTFVREISMVPDDEQRLAVRPAHRDYVAELHERGEIRMSGPLADQTGAIILYEAPDLEAARALVEADPYAKANVVEELSLREWTVLTPAG